MEKIEVYNNYLETQNKYPTALVFQENGNRHEVYGENAKLFSKISKQKLTTIAFGDTNNIPMCGYVFGSNVNVAKEKDYFDKVVIIHEDGIKTILDLR